MYGLPVTEETLIKELFRIAMRKKIFNIKRPNVLLIALLLCLLAIPGIMHAQCNWNIATPVTDSSRCAASGSISVSLTGSNVGSLSNIRYGLTSLSGGSFSIPLNASSSFSNVPAGTYEVRVIAFCNGQDMSKTVNVTVPGNYIPLVASATAFRRPLPNCNSGRISVSMQSGRKPYQINLVSKPAGYTGPVTFTTNNNSYTLDSLAGGDYIISITDNCATTAAQQNVSIPMLPAISSADIAGAEYWSIIGSCNSVLARKANFNWESPYKVYEPEILWAVGYDGGPKSTFKPLQDAAQEVVFPVGQTLKNGYGKYLNYSLKDACGGAEYTFNIVIQAPGYGTGSLINCTDINLSYLTNGPVCSPLYTVAHRKGTSEYYYDTLTAVEGLSGSFAHLPFGVYDFQTTTADGFVMSRQDYVATAPDAEPYYIMLNVWNGAGPYGNDGACGFVVMKKQGAMKAGTHLELISPTTYPYSYTAPIDVGSINVSYADVPTTASNRWFRPGEYLFRITDECGSYDLPIIMEEKDVYRYNMQYTQEQSCNGLIIIPGGSTTYQNEVVPSFYKAYSPTGGVSQNVVAQGTPILLTIPGRYTLIMSSLYNGVNDYSGQGGNAANKAIIDYNYYPLAIDVNRTLGWVCPGSPPNSGSINAYAVNGGSPPGSTFTYKLAAAGQGGTGPYLATNTTGKFSTATSGGAYELIAGVNYDVRVEDVCGAAAVQTVKITNLGGGQIAGADKSLYCVGDPVQFQVLNLSGTNFTYEWTGPNNYKSYQKNPVISQMTPQRAGMYIVKIQATDLCVTEIRDTIAISLAPYREICYSAVTDTSVNPYAFGLLGNWRPSRSYAYYGARKESDPSQATNIRANGTFQDFNTFWKLQQNKWKAQQDTTRWVWNAESVLFNKKGLELENKDPLGRYNSAIYGYDDAIPVAVAQNSRYREVAYEGFEDYGFTSAQCNTSCPADRRFDFSPYSTRMDTAQHHTGKYSLRVQPLDTIVMVSPVTDTALAMIDPAFTTGANACVAAQVLKKVTAGKSVLLPAFSPLAGKKVLFSAWVKEAQDCKCQSYSSNRVDLVVQKPGGNIIIQAHPQGSIIEGWQRYEQVLDLPTGATGLSMILLATGSVNVYFDDIRIHPFNANIKSYVYDATTLKLMAELDENNYSTFYEYDDDGSLTRVKKETERGVKTIKESRSALIKEDVE